PAPAAPPEGYVPRSEYEKLQRELESLKAQLAAAPGAKPVEIVITVYTYGPERESVYRYLNLVEAANRLNQIFQAAGVPATVKIEGEFSTARIDHRQRIFLMLEGGTGPCIFQMAHIWTAALAENGWIIPLDSYIKKYWNWTYYDIIPGLWNAVTYKGHIWGIPQDTEARPIYFNKLLLKKLGWTDDQINELPEKIKRGEFTLYDMLMVAKEAVDKGVVEPGYGIWHRPDSGPDWPLIYLAFGGTLYDEASGKLVADMQVWKKVFEWYYLASMKQYKVTLDKLTSLSYAKDVHPTVVSGKVLFWMGGTWHKGQWIGSYNLSEAKFWEMFGFALVPAGEKGLKPVTLSQPQAYFISKTCKYPEVAFLIVTLATDPYLNSLHAVKSAHLAILGSQLSNPVYAEDKFLAMTGYMVEYAKYQPLHPRWGDYLGKIYVIIKGIETGQFDPDEALRIFERDLISALGDQIIIKK
ncbi:MAG: extracellular solute-binding protein, partial [Thermofilum sp.]|nr:extracellular solute-binding protein [Thermofilum sp.]